MILLKQMLVLFLIMLVGFICRKLHLLDDQSSKKISGLVVNVANPALILSAGINPESALKGLALLKIMGLAIGFYAVIIVIAFILPKFLNIPQKDRGVYKVMLIFSNIGFMGFPLISAAYGSEALLAASLFLIPYNVLIYSYGISAMTQNKKANVKGGEEIESASRNSSSAIKSSIKKILNIGVLACLLSIVLYVTALPVPSVIENTVIYLSNLTAPLSMIIIGDSITQINMKELFTDVKILIFSIIKMLIIPLAGVFLLKAMGLSTTLTGVCMIMLATPVGSMTVMLAQQYEGDYETASKGVALTTVMSVITIPIISILTGI